MCLQIFSIHTRLKVWRPGEELRFHRVTKNVASILYIIAEQNFTLAQIQSRSRRESKDYVFSAKYVLVRFCQNKFLNGGEKQLGSVCHRRTVKGLLTVLLVLGVGGNDRRGF